MELRGNGLVVFIFLNYWLHPNRGRLGTRRLL